MSSAPDSIEPAGRRYWAVVPAAGVGQRMGADRPKQYLPLCGRTVLEHTLQRLCAHPAIAGVVVAIAAHDTYWSMLPTSWSKPLWVVKGGRERCDSVHNALEELERHAEHHDWVLVHDAARPCLRGDDVSALIEALRDDPVGGLLALPVSDTVKRCDSTGRVIETVDRQGLWRALTPQMFRLGVLREVLARALASGLSVTDEASAMEWAGYAPRAIRGHSDNVKITHAEDLALAELFLRRIEEGVCA